MADELYSYRLRYRTAGVPSRIKHLVVGASDADDARREAANLDPEFGYTVESPRRGRPIEVDPIHDAKRQEWLDDPETVAVWQGVEVEVS